MARAKAKFETQDYLIPDDRELLAEQQTTWRLFGLSPNDMDKVGDLIASGSKLTGLTYAARRGIVGWINFLSEKGEQIVFQGRVWPQDKEGDQIARCKTEEFDLIPREMAWVIGEKVLALSTLTAEEKNSSSSAS